MSSGFQSPDPQSIRLSCNNGAKVVQGVNPSGTAETRDAPRRLRLNSLNLDELSEELERRTKETQRLQEEVETATKETLERFGCTFGIHSSPGWSNHNYRFNEYDGGSSILSTQQQAVIQPLVCDLDILNQTDISSPGKKTHDEPEQETFRFDKAIVNLQTKLNKVQKEKDGLSDIRLKDSRTHVGQMEKMLFMLEEIQNIKRTKDQELLETEDETLALNRKVEALEQNVEQMYSLLYQETQHGDNAISSPNFHTSSTPAARFTDTFNDETEELQERLFLSINHLGSEGRSGVHKQKERMEGLISSLGQEMALLTDKLTSSKNNSISLNVKLELLKKLAERQTSLHQGQISELESALCSHKDQICRLEQQLIQAQSQLMDAQSERERSLQLGQLKRCGLPQQWELQEEVEALRGQLEAGRTSQKLLEEKHKDLQLRQQEAQLHLARLEEAQSRGQALQAEGETLRLKLIDREKMIESSVQMTVQHGRTIHDLHQENSLVSNQLNLLKMEIQQLRAELDWHKSADAAAEHERRQLQASVAEQRQRVQEESLEKKQLNIQLELLRMQLLSLTQEHMELQQLHSCRSEEQEGAVLKLQSQLRKARDERDQVGSTLRTLEGAEGHGLQVALDMQKEITARRQQVDSLQSKIKHLEEIMDKLYQEKRYQSLENQRQLHELTFVREEKKQLGIEQEALRSKDNQLRERIGQLEAILTKLSESFADCQDFIQLQEQDYFRLKLRHALDLKELQGQNTALNVHPPVLDSPSALPAPPCSQHASNAQITESPSPELRSLVRGLRGAVSGKHRPHTDNSRRSAPEKVHRTTFNIDKEEEVKVGSRLRRKTCGSEPLFLNAAELNGEKINNKFFKETSAARYSSFPQLLSLGRRSPVHALLTSDPNS
ncbi:coiled-coil domain-containing protein 158-like isoform X2 [Pseudochaenichthys georgianus]|uniref:coiled-coil domain-containing protein 158-like isoform X2 n=1 Tax=Pseudochaenichthys georgianus TaxID=52239 RepID=UPI00146AB06F|nr:coiled-coil domain-containing protein 158-like isoform X2 [Pseudochaenichthys georgianus]